MVSLGIMDSLLIGKPLGIFRISFLSVKIKDLRFTDKYELVSNCGAGLLGGIRFITQPRL